MLAPFGARLARTDEEADDCGRDARCGACQEQASAPRRSALATCCCARAREPEPFEHSGDLYGRWSPVLTVKPPGFTAVAAKINAYFVPPNPKSFDR